MKQQTMTVRTRRAARTALTIAGTLAGIIGALFAGTAQAQSDYPNKPITMVVNFAAGGATDIAGRTLAEYLREKLGQSVVVENLTGAGTSIGTARVARAPKDGYTILFSTASTFTITPHIQPSLNINLADFQAISRVGSVPLALSTRKDFPAGSLNEFVAAAKALPKGVSSGTAGAGSIHDILNRYTFKRLGIESVPIHYRGESAALPDLASGRTDAQFVSVAAAAQQLQTGAIRIIATASPKRAASLPNIPTFAELGYPDIFGDSWQIVMVPTGTAAPIVSKLSTAIADVMRIPSFGERLAKVGAEIPPPATPAEIVKLLGDEYKRWGVVVTENKITAN
jgi:tripartite-type tricarboxylate transporter receptor subunit TctC